MEEVENVGIGIDLGSSAVRVGLYNAESNNLIEIASRPVRYYHDSAAKEVGDAAWDYTQDSHEIMNAIEECFIQLGVHEMVVASCGVSATCSLVVCERDDKGNLIPFNNDSKNVVFWMDSTATEETKKLNEVNSMEVLNYLGGSFIPEMAIPKLFKFISHFPIKNCIQYELFDLHKYIAYQLALKYNWDNSMLLNKPNSNGIGNDGELSGWSNNLYHNILNLPQNVTIGPSQSINSTSNTKINSCIDCYSSWFATLPASSNDTLFMVAGTSTCYLYAPAWNNNGNVKHIKGIWGPFTDILDPENSVYETGSSCSGKFIEHLFASHPATPKLDSIQDIIIKIEEAVERWERQNSKSIYWEIRHCHSYGELDGNRTPLANPQMRGMFIGESTDLTVWDLVKKYVLAIESLAFQTKLLTDEMGKLGNINQIIITGSQAKNQRFLQLVSFLNEDISILVPKDNADLMGVKGAYLLGKFSSGNKSLRALIGCLNKVQIEKYYMKPYMNIPNNTIDGRKIRALLALKYEIYIDMIKRQQEYQQIVDSVSL